MIDRCLAPISADQLCEWNAVALECLRSLLCQSSHYTDTPPTADRSTFSMQIMQPAESRSSFSWSQQTILFQCWPTVFDAGPTLKQHCVNAPCLLGLQSLIVADTGNTFSVYNGQVWLVLFSRQLVALVFTCTCCTAQGENRLVVPSQQKILQQKTDILWQTNYNVVERFTILFCSLVWSTLLFTTT